MQHFPKQYRPALFVSTALGLLIAMPALAAAQDATTPLPQIEIDKPRAAKARPHAAVASNRRVVSRQRRTANPRPVASKPVVTAPQSAALNRTTDPNHQDPTIAPYQPAPADLGPLGTKPVLDTPQSVDFIPDTLIQNQQSKTVNDTLRYLPSVEVRDQQGLEVSRPQSRGFQSSIVANTRLDGLNIIGTTAIPTENLAGIQVLNGLSGALYGPTSPSGVFNYILKKPTDQPFFTYIESFDSHSTFTEQIDAGGRVGPDQKLGYRINVVHGQGESYVNDSYANRTLGSLYLD